MTWISSFFLAAFSVCTIILGVTAGVIIALAISNRTLAYIHYGLLCIALGAMCAFGASVMLIS